MKKFLLFFSAAALTLSASAATKLSKVPTPASMLPKSVATMPSPKAKAPSRASTEVGYNLKYSGDLNSWLSGMSSLGLNVKYTCYVPINAEIATKLAGNQITQITFSSYLQSTTTKPGTVFVTEDPEGEPVTSTAITVNGYNQDTYNQVQTENLETPYTIKAGQPFYYGFTVEKTTNKDYPIPISKTGIAEFGGHATLTNSSGKVINDFDIYNSGYYLYCVATTVGEKNAVLDCGKVEYVAITDFTLPTVEPGEALEANVLMSNYGDNDITSLEYNFNIDGVQYPSHTAEGSIPSMGNNTISFETPEIPAGRVNAKIQITKINSEPFDATFTVPILGVAADQQFPRMLVCEEGTGSWCGWCPWGIETLETLKQNYPDKFIGIAVHASDEYQSTSYLPLAYEFPEFPYSFLNRDMEWAVQPILDIFNYFDIPSIWTSLKTGAKIDLSVDYTDGILTARSKSQFAFSQNDADYSVAFAITEDGLAGSQKNYFSGMTDEEITDLGVNPPQGWVEKDAEVSVEYNDVARDIVDCWGIEGSIPTAITAGEKYSYSAELPLTNITDINKTTVVAMLLDNQTGVIINAAKVEAKNYTAGVDQIIADNSSTARVRGENGRIIIDGDYTTARVYSVNGALTARALGQSSFSSAKGLYIVVVDGTPHKVIVR